MEARTYLKRYRLEVDQIGLPVVIRRSPTEGTFRGQDLDTKENVAIQVVPLEALGTVVREELEAEAKTARELNHINIPVLRDAGVEDGHMIYVTEYFDGTPASDWVKKQGPMPVGAVLRIAQQVVNATSLATFHGIVHRMINPSNIMLVPGQTAEGEWPLIKVLNFLGVAPDLTPPDSFEEGETFHPSQFASPEQIQTGAVDFRSQVYSLGATLWFLLTGKPPLAGPDSVDDASRVPTAVKDLIFHMLANDPAERPLDPLALQAHIQDCLAQLDRRDAVASKFGLPLASEAKEPVKLPRRPFPWRPVAFAAVLLGLAAMTAVALSGYLRREKPIGVEVGIPENSAAGQVVFASPNATAPSPPPAATPNNLVVPPPGHEPPVVTSNESKKKEEEVEDAAANTNAEVAEATPAPAPQATAQPTIVASPSRIAAATSSPPVDRVEAPAESEQQSTDVAEGPTAAPQENVAAETRRGEEPAPQEKVVAQSRKEEEPAPVKSKPQKAKSEVAKSNEHKKVRVVKNDDDAPVEESSSNRRGTVRAQFLGTTPDGQLVFGLPSQEKVYVAPAVNERDLKPKRHQKRLSAQETLDGLPVLPALPPDQ